jgi:hypothetical protein
LQELFEALGNDPFVIAECLARPVLTERLTADLSEQNKTSQAQSAPAKRLRGMSMATRLGNVGYTLPKISEGGSSMHRRYLDSHKHHQCTLSARVAHSGLDQQRNDYLGWI